MLDSCKVGEYEINNLPKTIENILSLTLKDIVGLKYIGENVLFGNPIEIMHLKTLTIMGCNELVSVDIKCDIMESVALRNNLLLENIYIYSMHLKNIYVYNNPNMNLENLGLYISKGISVLVCKSSCHGSISKVIKDRYDICVEKVMKFLIEQFYVQEARTIILLTMSKMKEVDDNLFRAVGISSLKPISSLFSKYTG